MSDLIDRQAAIRIMRVFGNVGQDSGHGAITPSRCFTQVQTSADPDIPF